ncbi:Pre-mRNA-splicing factor SYF2 [Aphelenchoides besseyi]|nr:Pre-mRNA-splicing factor SYF2 [Aphelenchoides besseyi]
MTTFPVGFRDDTSDTNQLCLDVGIFRTDFHDDYNLFMGYQVFSILSFVLSAINALSTLAFAWKLVTDVYLKMSTSAETSSSSFKPPRQKNDVSAFMDRFKSLHHKREESRKLNHEQVVEEDRLSKLPQNHEAKRARTEWQLHDMEARKEAEEKGEDYERMKALNMQADIAEKIQAAKRRKKNPDIGFANFDAQAHRQYERITNEFKPDLESYKKMKQVVGDEEFYPTANTLITGSHYPTDAAMNKLVAEVDKQEKKREQYRRRRTFDPDAPVDHINERNRKFNKKLEHFYGEFTAEIANDLERGTAV